MRCTGFGKAHGFTRSDQFAVEAATYGGGQAASKTRRRAGFLACGIGLPLPEVAGDMNGLRIGTPELVRWGVTPDHAGVLADLIAEGLNGNPEAVAKKASDLRRQFTQLHYMP